MTATVEIVEEQSVPGMYAAGYHGHVKAELFVPSWAPLEDTQEAVARAEATLGDRAAQQGSTHVLGTEVDVDLWAHLGRIRGMLVQARGTAARLVPLVFERPPHARG